MIIQHPSRGYHSGIHTEEDEEYQQDIAKYKAKALEEAGPNFVVVDTFAVHGDYAYSWHYIVVLRAINSDEIRTYVYEEN